VNVILTLLQSGVATQFLLSLAIQNHKKTCTGVDCTSLAPSINNLISKAIPLKTPWHSMPHFQLQAIDKKNSYN
jgi:hypothetical protein